MAATDPGQRTELLTSADLGYRLDAACDMSSHCHVRLSLPKAITRRIHPEALSVTLGGEVVPASAYQATSLASAPPPAVAWRVEQADAERSGGACDGQPGHRVRRGEMDDASPSDAEAEEEVDYWQQGGAEEDLETQLRARRLHGRSATSSAASAVGSYSRSKSDPEPVLHQAITANILQETYQDVEDVYRIGQELGTGMSSTVRKCVHRSTGGEFACKTIIKAQLLCSEDVEALRREVWATRSVAGHSAVVELKEVFEDEEHLHFILELCKGGDLYDRICKLHTYPERDAARLCRSLVSVLSFCHSHGIIHRDLKPENILLVSPSSHTNIRVADFGQAKYCKPGETLRGVVGSAYYIAPEVLSGPYGAQADFWSLGIILYILLSGAPPFSGKTRAIMFERICSSPLQLQRGRWRNISEGAKDLVQRLLTRDPEQRITAAEVKRHPWMLQHCKRRPPTLSIPRSDLPPSALSSPSTFAAEGFQSGPANSMVSPSCLTPQPLHSELPSPSYRKTGSRPGSGTPGKPGNGFTPPQYCGHSAPDLGGEVPSPAGNAFAPFPPLVASSDPVLRPPGSSRAPAAPLRHSHSVPSTPTQRAPRPIFRAVSADSEEFRNNSPGHGRAHPAEASRHRATASPTSASARGSQTQSSSKAWTGATYCVRSPRSAAHAASKPPVAEAQPSPRLLRPAMTSEAVPVGMEWQEFRRRGQPYMQPVTSPGSTLIGGPAVGFSEYTLRDGFAPQDEADVLCKAPHRGGHAYAERPSGVDSQRAGHPGEPSESPRGRNESSADAKKRSGVRSLPQGTSERRGIPAPAPLSRPQPSGPKSSRTLIPPSLLVALHNKPRFPDLTCT